MNVAATANQDMLEEGAALCSSASSGKAAAKSAIVRRAACGDPPSPCVEEKAPSVGGADALPAPDGASSQLKFTELPLALLAGRRPC